MLKVTAPEGKITTFSYDSDHKITGITDARSVKTAVSYDTLDRVTSISHPITSLNTLLENNTSETVLKVGESKLADKISSLCTSRSER
ncbi:RHS repeat protein [Bacillus sp. ISL-46]|nr:RHS repeat protein [Bacillus sp. ISL-46]